MYILKNVKTGEYVKQLNYGQLTLTKDENQAQKFTYTWQFYKLIKTGNYVYLEE